MIEVEPNLTKSIKNFLNKNNISEAFLEFDENLEDLQIKVEKWLSVIDIEDKETFILLFENLIYLTRINLIEKLKEYFIEYKKNVVNYESSIFLPVTSFGGVFNGAVNVIECFQKAIRDDRAISKKNIAMQPSDFYDEFNLEDVKNIVFIDDVIGTGNTFRDFLIRTGIKTPRLIQNKNIYLISIYNLDKGLNYILQDLNNAKWNITPINTKTITDIFSDKEIYPSGKEVVSKKHKVIVEKYEKRLNKDNGGKYILGYKKSGILLSFYYNTPNNTLSTFWKRIDGEWNPLFPREDDRDKFNLNDKNMLKEMKKYRELKFSRLEFIKLQVEAEERRRG